MRLIDADAILKHIPAFGPVGELAYRDMLIDDIRRQIIATPTITHAPRWIPVEEALPESDGYKLTVSMPCPSCNISWFSNGRFTVGRYGGDITHWMPLPEPPKEERP